MIDKAKKSVEELMSSENSGHGMEHIAKVFDLAMQFAQTESCNQDVVALSALLHDVDDYKIFGTENQKNLTNAKIILKKIGANEDISNQVLHVIRNMGFSNRMKGVYPTTIEGMIVSDADMCDALGAKGIIRTHQYALKHGSCFFDKNAFPIENIAADKYMRRTAETSVCHFFEKLLKLKNLMLTNAGKQEANKRHDFMIRFLKQFFKEENVPAWDKYLNTYLKNSKPTNNLLNFYLEKVDVKNKDILYKLLQYSLFEESETDLNEMNSNAEFDYKYFDKYFTDNDRFAYFIKDEISGKLLGFAMINQHTEVVSNGWSIAEFLIIPKYRRLGIGKKVAFALFDMFKGNWEVSPSYGSEKALSFWEKTISEYCNNYDFINNIFVFSNKED